MKGVTRHIGHNLDHTMHDRFSLDRDDSLRVNRNIFWVSKYLDIRPLGTYWPSHSSWYIYIYTSLSSQDHPGGPVLRPTHLLRLIHPSPIFIIMPCTIYPTKPLDQLFRDLWVEDSSPTVVSMIPFPCSPFFVTPCNIRGGTCAERDMPGPALYGANSIPPSFWEKKTPSTKNSRPSNQTPGPFLRQTRPGV